MAVQENIAIIGIKDTSSVLLQNLMQQNFRLLLISKKETLDILSEELKDKSFKAEVELMDCIKSGCWEADIIVFLNPEDTDEQLIKRIYKVATQKTVVCISDPQQNTHFSSSQLKSLQELLPHSPIVQVVADSQRMQALLSGKNKEAVDATSVVFQTLGYTISTKEE